MWLLEHLKFICKIPQVSIKRWRDKQNVVYTYYRVLFNLKKEWNSETYYNMDKPWKHFAKWEKSVTTRQILYDSAYVEVGVAIRTIETKQNSYCWGPEEAGNGKRSSDKYRVSVLQGEKVLDIACTRRERI